MLKDEEKQKLDQEYKSLIELYFDVKRLIVIAEKEDGEQRLSSSAIAELRSAFDHIMRAHQIIYGVIDSSDVQSNTGYDEYKYCKENLSKAKGHVYRAGYDAYDVISIFSLDNIKGILQNHSIDIVIACIQDAPKSIFHKLDEAKKLCTEAKTCKDVVSASQEKLQYETYERAVKELKKIEILLLESIPLFEKFKKEKDKYFWKEIIFAIVIAFSFFLLGHFF